MYIMWYFVFGTLTLLIPAVVMLIVCIKKISYYEKEEEKVSKEIDKCMYDYDFDLVKYNQNRAKEKELRAIRTTLRDKRLKWGKINLAPGILCMILGATLLIFTLISTLAPFCARLEVEDYKATYEMYEKVSEGQSDVENIAISETANGYNRWLRDARLSKKRLGAFSGYYNQDLENLKYIGEK